MKVRFFVVLMFLGSFWTTANAQQAVPFAGNRVVTVMTQNVYGGVDAEVFAIPTAANLPDLLTKVGAVYQGYFARNFAERAAAFATEVEATRPELIALQEALLVRTQSPPDGPATPATSVALDYVQILLDALAARGLNYEVVAQATGFDAELPSALGFDVRHTDRAVILARSDLKTADLKLSNGQGGNFVTNCTIPGGIVGPITVRRAWAAIDVKIRGKSFRLLTTHLDYECLAFTSAVQQAQAAELLAGPGATTLPLLLVGDLNSRADGTGATYNNLLASGFADAWNQVGLGAGWTCCQAPDLLNASTTLDQRIDFVLFRGAWSALNAINVGQNPENLTPSGFWPSDHAGVVARLQLPQ